MFILFALIFGKKEKDGKKTAEENRERNFCALCSVGLECTRNRFVQYFVEARMFATYHKY